MILGKKQVGDAAGGWTFFTAPFLQVLNSLGTFLALDVHPLRG